MDPPIRLIISCICDRFEADGTVHDVHKQRSGKPCIATSPTSSAMVFQQFTWPPQKATEQCAHESGISRSSVKHVLKRAKWKVDIARLLHVVNEDKPDWRVQFCEWFQHMVHEDEEFLSKIVWSDEATFKLNGTVTLCSILGSRKSTHSHGQGGQFTRTYRLVWFVIQGFNWTVLFWRNSYWPCVPQHVWDIHFTCHSTRLWEWAILLSARCHTPHYHRDVRSYVNETLPGQWIWWRGSVEYPPCSPDLTRLNLCLWGSLKDVVYLRKQLTLETLQEEIETSCASIPVDTLATGAHALVCWIQKCLQANGGHFEHLF
jgi:hypothetical protein